MERATEGRAIIRRCTGCGYGGHLPVRRRRRRRRSGSIPSFLVPTTSGELLGDLARRTRL